MDLGLVMFPTHDAIPPGELGRAAEDNGFESLFFPEHTHIPASRESPWPGGAELPREYIHTYDPFVALTAVATATTTLRFGTGVCLVVERDPITLAKETASLDHLSGGRFLFGVGAGWNLEEMRNHGTDPTTRFALLRERVEAIRAIWTEDEASYHGTYVDFDRIWSWPKPVTPGGPPVLVGGGGPSVLRRVVACGDGWFPILGRVGDDYGARIAELNRLAAEAGRPRPSVTIYAASPREEALAGYAEAGVTRAVFLLPSAGADEVVPRVRALGERARATLG